MCEDIHSAKKQLRAQLRVAEPAGFDREAASALIWDRVCTMPSFKRAGCVLAYVSLPGEVDTAPLLAAASGGEMPAVHSGKVPSLPAASPSFRIALPCVVGDSLVLRQYDPARMASGYRGIPEPGPDCPEIEPAEVDFAIVPGVAFDADGARLGHGGGFYDRLLGRLDCPKVGVCFSWRLVERVPVLAHDMYVDTVVTD